VQGNQSEAKLVVRYIPFVQYCWSNNNIINNIIFKQDVKKWQEHGSIEAGKETSIHQDKANNYKEFQDVFQVKQVF
jgi:hypothetical protein